MSYTDAYTAIAKAAHEAMLPKHYHADLFLQDWNYLREHKPRVFGWVLYDCGTHLVDPGDTLHGDRGPEPATRFWRRILRTMFTRDRHCFVWTGNELMEVESADDMCDLLESYQET